MLTSRARLPRRTLWIALPVLALLALIVFLPAFLYIRGAHAYRPATATSLPGTWAKMADAQEAFGPLLLLPSGKVMQAVVDNYPTTAHLYDPATNTWSDTSPLGYDIYGPTATLLKDGTVLLAGGEVFCSGYLCETAGAVIYNPATDKWSATTPMNTPRAGHSATLLPDGRVLVAGGYDLTSAEIYDPTTQQWSSAGNMHGNRFNHTAIELADNRVFVVGGYTFPGNTTSGGGPNCPAGGCAVFDRDTEIYDIDHNTWSTDVPLPDTRTNFTVTLLPNGLVLLAGGVESDHYTFPSASELYDPLTHAYSATGNMVAPRASHTATLLATGQVLVASGFNPTSGLLMSAEVYDPSTNTWLSTGNLPGYDWHAYASATLLANGQALVVGGRPSRQAATRRGPPDSLAGHPLGPVPRPAPPTSSPPCRPRQATYRPWQALLPPP